MAKKDAEYYTYWRNNTLLAKMKTDKKYAVLKLGGHLISTGGLGWYILYTLCGIRFAVENDFVPVIDWRNCKIPQYNAAKVGKENIWEYYFEQPFNISAEEAYKSDDFFLIDDVREFASINILDLEKFVDFFDEDLIIWRQFFQKYIRLKKEVTEYFEKLREENLLCGDKNMIGILARGTDYKELRPVGHLSPIPVEKIFDITDDALKKLENTEIFLATEDQEILKAFKDKYPDKVNAVDAKRYDNLGKDTLNTIYKNEEGYVRDLKYLYSIYVISKSAIGIYSACGGGAVASLMREDFGISYSFLCEGYNRAKGIIVGSSIEKERGELILMGDKPLMFYALNTLRLLHVKEVDVIISEKLKAEYQKLIGNGEKFDMVINYIISDTYNPVEYMANTPEFMSSSRLILLYTDYFVHGKDVVKEMSEKISEFDGAYAWGTRNYYSDDTYSIRINKTGIPDEACVYFKKGNYTLLGKYVFDFDLKEVVKTIKRKDLINVINEYIIRRKMFFLKYKRGTFYSKISEETNLEKTSQTIKLMEELQNEKIGDFMSFSN